jgi:hypothetical protein
VPKPAEGFLLDEVRNVGHRDFPQGVDRHDVLSRWVRK